MIAARLPAIDGPTIICTQAGNVNTGAFDPIGEICDVARPAGAWVHVDGAFVRECAERDQEIRVQAKRLVERLQASEELAPPRSAT